ncbi:MAG: exodeoxyribonuclease VII large subunit [Pirellulaceae bacterium]
MSIPRTRASADPPVLTVGELTRLVKDTLHEAFAGVWVSGELSDVSRPQSGHVYFTLKDAEAQIRGVIWRSVASRFPFALEEGLEVLCCGDIDVYPPRGTYQLIVRQLEPRGVGGLQLAFRQLQQRLAAEGLFDSRHKQPLPRIPRRIGFVTSPTGAAVRDFLESLRNRWSPVEVLIIPARVQGEGAADEIVRGIRWANRLQPPLDVLVVGRGGGSLEDLWCFNEERVVRAIFASRVPVVSAVGHEIDVTLSDLVADERALTPTDAAHRIVPSRDEVRAGLQHVRQRLVALLRARAATARARLAAFATHRVFRRPLDRVRERIERLDEYELRAQRALRVRCAQSAERLRGVANQLESLSPLAVLARGYSVTARTADGMLVTDAEQLHAGDRLVTRFARGSAVSRIEQADDIQPLGSFPWVSARPGAPDEEPNQDGRHPRSRP